jgi:hypothetical protein
LTEKYGGDPNWFGPMKSLLERSYVEVLDSLNDKSLLPYRPDVYLIPFMLSRKYKMGLHLVSLLFYGLSYPDATDFSKYSIYIVASLAEKFPQHMTGVIAHEIAHIIATKGEVRITEEDLLLILKNRIGFLKAKETIAEHYYSYFSEPVSSSIKKWNEVALLPETEREVSDKMMIVNQEKFNTLIFGERLPQFREFVRTKLEDISKQAFNT